MKSIQMFKIKPRILEKQNQKIILLKNDQISIIKQIEYPNALSKLAKYAFAIYNKIVCRF